MRVRGLQAQIRRNNFFSLLLLAGFPLLLALLFFILLLIAFRSNPDPLGDAANAFALTVPYLFMLVGCWFIFCLFSYRRMVFKAVGASRVERKEQKELYNLLENLCISCGMRMPALYLIEDASLNAMAGGLSQNQAFVVLSSGLVEGLEEAELEAVLAHELAHIRNADSRLMMIALIFTGIFGFLAESILRQGNRGSKRLVSYLLMLVSALLFYLLSLLMRAAISRHREFLADASALELTRNIGALESALQKVHQDPQIEALKRADLAQLFIANPGKRGHWLERWFATHPPLEDRLAFLKQL